MQNKETRFSVAKLNELTEGDAEGRDTFLRLFASQTAGSEIKALELALRQSAFTEAAVIAHRMRTALSFFGLAPEVKYLEALEIAANNNQWPQPLIDHFPEFCNNIIDVSGQLLTELQERKGRQNGQHDPGKINR